MNPTTDVLWVALGGAAGAAARYWVSGVAYRLLGAGFPWGTLTVNVLGSFCLGVTVVVLEGLVHTGPARTVLAIGFLGAFTTFSTFSYETLALFQDGAWARGGAYALGSLAAGLAAVAGGFAAGSLLLATRS